MTPLDSALDSKPPVHWTVTQNYPLRTVFFVVLFFSVVLHGWDKAYSPVFWSLIALQLLVYPHLVFWLARHSPNSQHAEVRNLTVDCVLLGILIAALQFPLWITFNIYLGCTLNLTITRGLRGLLRSQLAFLSGGLIALVVWGWHASPETGWAVSLLSAICCVTFVLVIGLVAHSYNQQSRATRAALLTSEQTLKQQLVEIQIPQDKLQEQAVRDPLTGLYNRRFLDSIVGRELARCEREGLPLALMMIDVDHFKKVNDTYGHPGGDVVLKKLATLLLEKVRAIDVACRYGGEEFLLLLPNMAAESALVRAEQCRQAFADEGVLWDALRIQVTMSIGIACYPQHGDTLPELTRCADLALYRAKQEGRNRVVLYQPDM